MKRMWIRDARQRANLTQAELAARIGKPQNYISKIEAGAIVNPSFDAVVSLAKALGVNPLALRFGKRAEAA